MMPRLNGKPGFQRTVLEVDLEVVGKEQEHREQAGADQQEQQV
jgi:hypothetical protein